MYLSYIDINITSRNTLGGGNSKIMVDVGEFGRIWLEVYKGFELFALTSDEELQHF